MDLLCLQDKSQTLRWYLAQFLHLIIKSTFLASFPATFPLPFPIFNCLCSWSLGTSLILWFFFSFQSPSWCTSSQWMLSYLFHWTKLIYPSNPVHNSTAPSHPAIEKFLGKKLNTDSNKNPSCSFILHLPSLSLSKLSSSVTNWSLTSLFSQLDFLCFEAESITLWEKKIK